MLNFENKPENLFLKMKQTSLQSGWNGSKLYFIYIYSAWFLENTVAMYSV